MVVLFANMTCWVRKLAKSSDDCEEFEKTKTTENLQKTKTCETYQIQILYYNMSKKTCDLITICLNCFVNGSEMLFNDF